MQVGKKLRCVAICLASGRHQSLPVFTNEICLASGRTQSLPVFTIKTSSACCKHSFVCRSASMIHEPKTAETIERISAALSKQFVFKGIDTGILQQVSPLGCCADHSNKQTTTSAGCWWLSQSSLPRAIGRASLSALKGERVMGGCTCKPPAVANRPHRSAALFPYSNGSALAKDAV